MSSALLLMHSDREYTGKYIHEMFACVKTCFGSAMAWPYVPSLTLGLVAMALGDADAAFEWLEQEYRDRGILLWSMKAGWWFDDFRADPRFQALLRRMHFPETAPPS